MLSDAGVAQSPVAARPGWRINYQHLVNWTFAAFICCGAIALVEPSPYDFASFIAIPIWFLGGFKLHRRLIPFLALLVIYNLAGFIALIPYWNERDPRTFMLQSLYLAVTGIFFAIFFSENTLERTEVCLKAFAASTVIAAISAIVGYFNIAGLGPEFATYGRAAGTFKDPNVLGSYIILGALYLTQTLMLGRARHWFIVAMALLLDLTGIMLSFSRGSWGAFVFASTLMVGLTFITTRQPALRRRIIIVSIVALTLLLVMIAVALSVDQIRELAFQRAQAPGDEYQDPRFGNQLQSLPMLLDRPNGFGPLRFRLFFGLEPHSSYVNGFASYGWLGGFSFLLLVGTTAFVGFRLVLTASPFQRLAQIIWPALLVFLLQGFQIDIDHWRHVFLMLGAVWGMEAARVRWLAGRRAVPDRGPPSPHYLEKSGLGGPRS